MKYRGFLLTQGTGRYFSLVLLSLCVAACGDSAGSEPTGEFGVTRVAMPVGVDVAIDPQSFPSDLPDTAMLFIFVREPGERMPLAVEYFVMNDVPASIPFRVNSATALLEVVARISPTAKVEKSEADIELITQVKAQHPPATIRLELSAATAQNTNVKGQDLANR